MSAVAVRQPDLRILAGMVTAERADIPPAGLPLSLLSDLMSQIRCDTVSCAGLDSNRRQTWFSQEIPDHDGTSQQSVDEEHWEHYNQDLFDTYPERSGDLRSIVKISDFYSARQFRDTGMCLDVQSSSTANGARIQQWACNGTNAQRWVFEPRPEGGFAIRPRASNKCLDVENFGTNNGARVQQWDCYFTDNQRWNLY